MMHPPKLTPEQQARAVRLADERCESDMEIFGITIDDEPGCFALTDELGLAVRSLKQAGGTLRESFEWLQMRGLASLRLGAQGIIVEFHRRRK